MVVGIDVQDAGGHPLPANERFPDWSTCFGHGKGPRPFPKGKVIPIERTLGNQGRQPNHPGTFTIVIKWAPCFGTRSESPTGGRATDLKPCATVHATATIHLVCGGGSLSN
jgi:hypothetical protein